MRIVIALAIVLFGASCVVRSAAGIAGNAVRTGVGVTGDAVETGVDVATPDGDKDGESRGDDRKD